MAPRDETSATLHHTISLHGGNDASLNIEIAQPINPSQILSKHPNSTQAFIQATTHRIQHEVKHSANWTCSCGRPGTEVIHSPMCWMGPDMPGPPYEYRIMDIAGVVCVDGGVCRENWMQYINGIASTTGIQDVHKVIKPYVKGPDPVNPICGSCYVCKKVPESKLLKCNRCKLMRYCGAECQKKDWVRHKGVCKFVEKVEPNKNVVFE